MSKQKRIHHLRHHLHYYLQDLPLRHHRYVSGYHYACDDTLEAATSALHRLHHSHQKRANPLRYIQVT
ncbi:hypothetical protein G6F65_023254 [Rhizopus arrhizus]|nr:hypothetical protein G6F65_023254 [Rhizopus arrhizus]